LEWPDKRVAFDWRDLIRGVAFNWSGLIRGWPLIGVA
jgi:hypothetical protein